MFDVRHSLVADKPNVADPSIADSEEWNKAHTGRHPAVNMFPLPTSGEWIVYRPDGHPIDIAASLSEGFQEAINEACNNGWDLHVTGRGVNASGSPDDLSVIVCQAPIIVPPLQIKNIYIGGATIAFPSPFGANNGIVFNSCMMVNFFLAGQIAYGGTLAAVTFKPTNPVPLDGLTTIVDSHFRITTVAHSQSGAMGVLWDPDGGSIAGNEFKFVEVNGDGAGTMSGLIAKGNPTHAFAFNKIRVMHLHGCKGVSLSAGISGANDNVFSNEWEAWISPGTGAGPAVQTYENSGIYKINIHDGEGVAAEGIKLEAPAQKNRFIVMQNRATTPVNDQSTTKDSEGLFREYRPRCSVHRNGSNQTGIVTSTWTKVQFNSEVYDKANAYDAATNHRWSPGRQGIGHISAAVQYTAPVDGALYKIAVYKNGALYKEAPVDAGSTKQQGPNISVDVEVSAGTDFFEIFTWHDSGSNKDISGAAAESYAMYRMVD